MVEIEPGAALPEHEHVNEQFGIVIEGSVTSCVGEEERLLGPGGIWRIAAGMTHSVLAGDAGAAVVDVFFPPRDWPESEMLARRPPTSPWSTGTRRQTATHQRARCRRRSRILSQRRILVALTSRW